jgi:hypothetical protein
VGQGGGARERAAGTTRPARCSARSSRGCSPNDELVDPLGRDTSADQAAERERKAEAEYAAGVLDILKVGREDLGDPDRAQALVRGLPLRARPAVYRVERRMTTSLSGADRAVLRRWLVDCARSLTTER